MTSSVVQATVTFLLFLLFRRSVEEFVSTSDVLYKKQYSTISIIWLFNYDGVFVTEWDYKKQQSSPAFTRIYGLTTAGQPPPFTESPNQFSDRITFIGDVTKQGTKSAALSIRNFKKDDEGIFRCTVKAMLPFSHEITIKAIVPSNITAFTTMNKNVNDIVVGDNVILSCTATIGEPSPKIELLRGGSLLNSTDGSSTTSTTLFYNFEIISRNAEGAYICQVRTNGEITSRKELRLNVKYPPQIDKSVKTEQLGCLGRRISLGCQASGNPRPDTRIIGPDGARFNNEFILAKFGVYRCEAVNALGNDSLDITVSLAKDKPEKVSFSECTFTRLTWNELPDKSVLYTLQSRETSSSPWAEVITSTDTSYSPSTNESFSRNKGYEFIVIASNCGGEQPSEICSVEGEKLTPEEQSGSSSSNTGVIVGCVIAALVVIIIIIIVAIYCKRRKRDRPVVKVNRSSETTHSTSNKQGKKGDLLYSDSPNLNPPRAVRPPVEYRQDEDDGYIFENDETARKQNENIPLSNSVPSWV